MPIKRLEKKELIVKDTAQQTNQYGIIIEPVGKPDRPKTEPQPIQKENPKQVRELNPPAKMNDLQDEPEYLFTFDQMNERINSGENDIFDFVIAPNRFDNQNRPLRKLIRKL